MTAYRLRRERNGAIVSATDATECVFGYLEDEATGLPLSEISGLKSISRAIGGGTAFTLHIGRYGAGSQRAATLTVNTLDASALGALVFVKLQTSSGREYWERATVIRIGDGITGPNGTTIDGTARAAQPADANEARPSGNYRIGPEAEDGSQWFVNANGVVSVRCGALSTVAALSAGVALVEPVAGSGDFIVIEL